MLGAGTIIGPILKLLTTVAILGAAYLFIVKPVLDTTDRAFDQFGFDNFGETFENVPTNLQDQVEQAIEGGGRDDAKRLRRCIDRAVGAGAEQQRINRCIENFS